MNGKKFVTALYSKACVCRSIESIKHTAPKLLKSMFATEQPWIDFYYGRDEQSSYLENAPGVSFPRRIRVRTEGRNERVFIANKHTT
jgi:Mg2+ and Co2+ transporter CorA